MAFFALKGFSDTI